jgi:hypothetical protein
MRERDTETEIYKETSRGGGNEEKKEKTNIDRLKAGMQRDR